jgi:hypothetical protein
LLSKTEKRSDVVTRAGGFTLDAALDAAYFGRATEATSFRRAIDLDSTDAATKTIERARIGLDLQRAMRPVVDGQSRARRW